MPFTLRSTTILLTLSALLIAPMIANAAPWGVIVEGIPGCNFSTGELTAACIPRFVGHIITLIFGLVGTFFVLNVMYAGYQLALGYIGEGGADKGAGKDRLKYSIIGLIVTTCSYLILDLVLSVILG